MKLIKKLNWFLSSQIGIDLRRMFFSIYDSGKYISDLLIFRMNYKGKIKLMPCFSDWRYDCGFVENEYFWQDLYVAREIFKVNPKKHVDVGSKIDTFVAHVASFRKVEIFDIRQMNSEIPGVIFKQADLMKPLVDHINYCDSISCLHALEHFGLGRYGDTINVEGYKQGLFNMASILKDGGFFYLSVPTGFERVEFNAHRVFNPLSLVEFAKSLDLSLLELAWIDPITKLNLSRDQRYDLNMLANQHYMLAIFIFIKG